MVVNWHGCTSVPRHIKGGGAQGATLGILEYLSQSNNNADCVSMEDNIGQDIGHLLNQDFVVVVRVSKARCINHLY